MCDYIKKYLKRNTYVYISPEAFDCANKIVCDCIIWAQFALSGEAEKRRSGEAEKRRSGEFYRPRASCQVPCSVLFVYGHA